MRESVIEAYLHEQVEKAGGTTRKFLSTLRANNPDRIVIWRQRAKHWPADVHFVEVKAPGVQPNIAQLREHLRLRRLGCVVEVIDSREKVDVYVEQWRR